MSTYLSDLAPSQPLTTIQNTAVVIRERTWTGADGTAKSCWQADFGAVNGKRLMRSFGVKADAENWLHEQRLLLEDQGHAAFSLSDAERVDAVKARDELRAVTDLAGNAPLETVAKRYAAAWMKLQRIGRTVEEAVAFTVKHHPANGEKRTIADVAEEYARDAEEHNLRPASIRGIRAFLKRLVAKHGQRQSSQSPSRRTAGAGQPPLPCLRRVLTALT